MAKFDLKTGYHQLATCEEEWAHMCFEWRGQVWFLRVATLGKALPRSNPSKLARGEIPYAYQYDNSSVEIPEAARRAAKALLNN